MPPFGLALSLQAACGVARSFLGPNKGRKCVIDDKLDSRSCLVASAQAFLLAAEGDPTTTTLLLEAMESQAPSCSDSPSPGTGPGSGATWLAVFSGLLMQHALELVESQGVPYECMRSGVLQAVAECSEVVRGCSLSLSLVSEKWHDRDVACYAHSLAALMDGGSDPGGTTLDSIGAAARLGQPPARPEPAEKPLLESTSVRPLLSDEVSDGAPPAVQSRGRGPPAGAGGQAGANEERGRNGEVDDEFGWFDDMIAAREAAAAAAAAATVRGAAAEAATAGATVACEGSEPSTAAPSAATSTCPHGAMAGHGGAAAAVGAACRHDALPSDVISERRTVAGPGEARAVQGLQGRSTRHIQQQRPDQVRPRAASSSIAQRVLEPPRATLRVASRSRAFGSRATAAAGGATSAPNGCVGDAAEAREEDDADDEFGWFDSYRVGNTTSGVPGEGNGGGGLGGMSPLAPSPAGLQTGTTGHGGAGVGAWDAIAAGEINRDNTAEPATWPLIQGSLTDDDESSDSSSGSSTSSSDDEGGAAPWGDDGEHVQGRRRDSTLQAVAGEGLGISTAPEQRNGSQGGAGGLNVNAHGGRGAGLDVGVDSDTDTRLARDSGSDRSRTRLRRGGVAGREGGRARGSAAATSGDVDRDTYGDGSHDRSFDGGASSAEEEAMLMQLEEEAAWFFEEGELEAEREARAQGRMLRRLGARLEMMLGPEAGTGSPAGGGGNGLGGSGSGGSGGGRGDGREMGRQGVGPRTRLGGDMTRTGRTRDVSVGGARQSLSLMAAGSAVDAGLARASRDTLAAAAGAGDSPGAAAVGFAREAFAVATRRSGSAGASAGQEGCSSAEEEAMLVQLEEEAAWFFDEGELEAERAARAQGRVLRHLGAHLDQMLGPATDTTAASGRPIDLPTAPSTGSGPRRGTESESARCFLSDTVRPGDQASGLRASSGNTADPVEAAAAAASERPPERYGRSDGAAERDDTAEGSRGSGQRGPPAAPDTGSDGQGSGPILNDMQVNGGASASCSCTLGSATGGTSGGGTSSSHGTAAPRAPGLLLDPVTRIVCTAAAGLAHGRDHEMRLAAAAVLTLLRPLVPSPAPVPPEGISGGAMATGTCESTTPASAYPRPTALADVAERVREAATALSYDRCILTAELMGRAEAAGTASVLRGVCIPLGALSPSQASLASEVLTSRASALTAAAQDPEAPGKLFPPPQSSATRTSAVFFQGSFQLGDASKGSVVVADGNGLAVMTKEAREERLAARLLTALRPCLEPQSPPQGQPQAQEQRQQPGPQGPSPSGQVQHDPHAQPHVEDHYTEQVNVDDGIAPQQHNGPPLLLLLASGHVPDRVSALLHELSGGSMLALGSVGLRPLRAAAAACSVAPAASLGFLNPRRHVARGVDVGLVAGGLDVRDYRPGAGGVRGGDGASSQGTQHVQHGVMLRLLCGGSGNGVGVGCMTAPPAGTATAADGAVGIAVTGPSDAQRLGGGREAGPGRADMSAPVSPGARAAPGWVTVLLAHPVRSELEAQAAAFRTCFNRLVAALRSGQVLPGAGAWELAAAEHLMRRAAELEQQQAMMMATQEEPEAADLWAAAEDPEAMYSGSVTEATNRSEGLARWLKAAEAAQAAAGRQYNLYLPLSYRAVASALLDVVHVLLQNGGCSYGEALAAAGACAGALRGGDVGALRRLAGATAAAATAGSDPLPRQEPLDRATAHPAECGELASALAAFFELKESSTAVEATSVPLEPLAVRPPMVPPACPGMEMPERLDDSESSAGGQGQSSQRKAKAQVVPSRMQSRDAWVLDELGARVTALTAGSRLVMLAASVDEVIVNR